MATEPDAVDHQRLLMRRVGTSPVRSTLRWRRRACSIVAQKRIQLTKAQARGILRGAQASACSSAGWSRS